MRFNVLDAVRTSILLGSLAIAGCASPTFELARTPDRNVLLITIDTLRGDALGADGGPARTPNIDALAHAGLRFSFAHAHAVVTLPSHASILTGLYPFQHGYRENSGYRLAPGATTLASRLKAAGFTTGAFVAAFPLDARFGLTPGFDLYDGRFDDVGSGAEFLLPERPGPIVVQRAAEWIRAQQGRWFAWVHLYEPHAPYRPPPPFDAEYAQQPYFGEVAAADHALAPLLELVRAATASRSTLTIVTGDHGEGLGDHGEMTHGLFAYESTLHVPLVIADVGGPQPPSPARGGEAVTEPARHVDIVPTILDALGLAVPSELPGHSLRTRDDRRNGDARASYFEAMESMLAFGFAPLDGVVVGREKFINLPVPEFYALDRDRLESQNLFSPSSDRVRVLTARLSELHPLRPDAPRAETAAVAAGLRALGYVSGGEAPKATYTERDDPKALVDIERLMHDGVALDEQGAIAEAIARYQAILAKRPAMAAASRHIAFDYWRLGNLAGAIEALRAAARLSAPAPGLLIQLGTYLSEAGRSAEAVGLLERAVASDPNLDALNALGIAYARAGRSSDALATFARSLDIDPSSAMTFENIGAVQLDAGRLSDARQAFERAVASNAASSQGHAWLAMVAIRQGDRATAIEQWERAVALQPSNFDALYDLGIQLAQSGRVDDARKYLAQFVATAPRGQYQKDIDKVSALLARLK